MSENLLLDDPDIYQQAMEIGEYVWNMVAKWDYFSKRVVGGQYVEAADSIASNIAEGYGRHFIKTGSNFIIIAGVIT